MFNELVNPLDSFHLSVHCCHVSLEMTAMEKEIEDIPVRLFTCLALA